MRKVKISLPATITNLGPGLNSLGLAIGLRASVEIRERQDEELVVETEGEGAGRYSTGLRHPVVLALMRVFQKIERAPLGMTIKIDSKIPLSSGLGAETTFTVAGIIAANNILNNIFTREQVLELAAQISKRGDGVVTAMIGGFTASTFEEDKLTYRTMPVAPFTVVVAVPELDGYLDDAKLAAPERVTFQEALANINRLPFLVDALRSGDYKLLARALEDHLREPALRPLIPGYGHVVEMARRGGAYAVTLSGDGPALVAFAEKDHKKIAEAMQTAFDNSGVKARTWILPIDTQGVVISVAQTA